MSTLGFNLNCSENIYDYNLEWKEYFRNYDLCCSLYYTSHDTYMVGETMESYKERAN
jgi:hypothetical protein